MNQLSHSVVQNMPLSPRIEDISLSIMEEFTPDELEHIAQSSYSYWYACETGEITDRDEIREGMALREIARYLDAAKEDRELTTMALKRTAVYRQQYRIDIIRSCFDESFEYKNEEDAKLAKRYRDLISKELTVQPMLVKTGATGRGVLNMGARCSSETDEEGYILAVIYMIERVVAVTESLSEGSETQMDVVIDASCLKSKYCPSRSTLKTVIKILQDQYPQRLNTLIVLDPPFWLSTFWSVLSVFVDQRTRNKLQLARGTKAKKSILGDVLQFPSSTEEDAIEFVATVPFEATSDLQRSCRILSQ